MSRRFLASLFIVSFGLGLGALASAEVVPPFAAGDKLEASKLNTKFRDLEERLAAAEARGAGSNRKAYCGSTAATKGDLSGLGSAKGYPAARAACKAIATCNGTTAHVCSGDEVVNDASLGFPMPSGRFQNGYAVQGYGGVGVNWDCMGWQQNGPASSPFWNGAGAPGGELTPAGGSCDVDKPLLCCN